MSQRQMQVCFVFTGLIQADVISYPGDMANALH